MEIAPEALADVSTILRLFFPLCYRILLSHQTTTHLLTHVPALSVYLFHLLRDHRAICLPLEQPKNPYCEHSFHLCTLTGTQADQVVVDVDIAKGKKAAH
jgi:hypothetical protein